MVILDDAFFRWAEAEQEDRRLHFSRSYVVKKNQFWDFCIKYRPHRMEKVLCRWKNHVWGGWNRLYNMLEQFCLSCEICLFRHTYDILNCSLRYATNREFWTRDGQDAPSKTAATFFLVHIWLGDLSSGSPSTIGSSISGHGQFYLCNN